MPKVKVFPVKFRPEEDIPTYKDEFQEGFETCERINSAKVCDDERTFKMLYCRTRRGNISSCNVVSSGEYLNGGATYIAWYGATPGGKGHGKHFYEELEKFLAKKRCVKRINLHALEAAEPFWERMGFDDVDPEDWEEWHDVHEHLRKMTKRIGSEKGCVPEKAVADYEGPVKTHATSYGDEHQKSLDHFAREINAARLRSHRGRVGRIHPTRATQLKRDKLTRYR